MPPRPSVLSRTPAWLGVLFVLVLVQWPLILNPGYFSHDELEWWARADVSAWTQLPWVSWIDLSAFQYRPLTFNLWLMLAWCCASTPYAMHLVVVGIGSANALALGRCVEAAGASRRSGIAAALVFVLTPYAAYTHGWTATLADLLVVAAALLSLGLLQRMSGANASLDILRGALVFVLTGLALLSKESAVVLPAFLLLGLYRHPQRSRALATVALSAALVAIYLVLRLHVVLATPHEGDAYAWSIGNIPRRLSEYLLFPFTPPLLEVGPTLLKSAGRLIAAAACLAVLLAALARAGWRWPLAWLAQFTALLAPVLILGHSYGQYAYFASAAAVGIVAAAWQRLHAPARAAIGIVAAVAIAHATAIQWRMRDVGVAQDHFYADLVVQLATAAGPVAVASADPADGWMIERFLSGVTSYRGVPIGGRVRQADGTGDARLIMQADGHLLAAGKQAAPAPPI
jgi:hypothetical protein